MRKSDEWLPDYGPINAADEVVLWWDMERPSPFLCGTMRLSKGETCAP